MRWFTDSRVAVRLNRTIMTAKQVSDSAIAQRRLAARRGHPRLDVRLQASLTLPDGATLCGETRNVSLAGFQVRAAPAHVACLFPVTRQPGPRERQHADAALCAQPDVARATVVRVRCAAVFARRTAEHEYEVGFEFLQPAPAVLAWLQTRIAATLHGPRTAQGER